MLNTSPMYFNDILKASVWVYSGHSNEYGPAPGGRQLVGQAENLIYESACRLPQARHSPIAISIITRSHKAGNHFTVPQRIEGWVNQ